MKEWQNINDGVTIMKKYQFLIGFTILVLFFCLVLPCITFAQPYYKGKTLTIMVPHDPGGGTDIFARLAARYLPKYIPGEPTVIVRNMLGGMTLVCSNHVYNVAKKDGLTAFASSGASAMHSLLRTKGTRFTYDDMPVTMVVPSGEMWYTRQELVPDPKEIVNVAKGLVFGSPPMPYSLTTSFMLARELFGFQTKKDVLAFHSGTDTRRAFLSGEIDIMGESTIGYAKGAYPLVKKGEVMPLWQSGLYDAEGNLVREGGVAADVPTIEELYKEVNGRSPSGPAWNALSAYIAYDRTICKALLFPPGTEKYASIIREAVIKMAKDPKFQKQADKMLLGAPVYAGQEAIKMMDNAAAKAKASRSWLQDWIYKGWGVEFEE